MRNTTSIGSFIAALRKANGMTQKQLAEKLNVSDKSVSRWERDECAPDLSLIPVLAELFGITSDELLRGQRANPDTVPTPQAEEKSKKRLQYLLDQTVTRYKIQSLISVGIALVGVIAALILNAFHRAQAGFLVGCVFFLAATICQIIFLTLSRAKLQSEEFEETAVSTCRSTLIRSAEWVFGSIALLLFVTMPLILVDNPYWGLTVPSLWSNGLAFALIPAILTPIVCIILNYKLGVYAPMGAKGKLRLRLFGVLLTVVFITGILHFIVAILLSNALYLYSPCTKFDTFDDFKEHMETPLSPDGKPLTLYFDGDEYRIYTDSEGSHYIANRTEYISGKPETSFYNANKTVQKVSRSKNAIYVHDSQQYTQAKNRFIVIMLLIVLLYPAEIAVTVLLYRKKAKVTQK